MTTAITVSFDKKELHNLEHDVHANNHVIKKLKARGIPVVGGIWLRGVERGHLEMFNEGDKAVYRWTPGEDSDEEEL